MKSGEKVSGIVAIVEIVIAAILFVTMIITCGMYIDVKMNGKTSSLPALSEMDKKVLLRTAAAESVHYNDDLIEPTFIGVKNGGVMIAACPENTARRSFETAVYDTISSLFSGSSEKVEFADSAARDKYIENLKYSNKYMLIGFYSDMASTVFPACISDNYDIESGIPFFYVRNLFLLPDTDGNLYAISVSGDNDVNLIYPANNITYGKIVAESYDVSDGYSYFEYEDKGIVSPVLTSSFMTNKYRVESLAKKYGKDKDNTWIENLFEVFAFNSSLVKEFTSKNSTEINFVEEDKEMLVNDEGRVEFKVIDSDGVYLEKYLGFMPNDGEGYTFNDKIFAVKSLVNKLNYGDNIKSFNIAGVDFNAKKNIFKVYLKCMVDGIMITENSHDAMFEFDGDFLTYAEFSAFYCEKTDDYSMILPQKHSNKMIDDIAQSDAEETEAEVPANSEIFCAVLSPEGSEEGLFVMKWAKAYINAEVDK